MMTTDEFRKIALAIPGAVESSHMNHPDFRIGGRIFASLGYPDNEHGMVKLTPEQQSEFLKKAPRMFSPCAGAWGKRLDQHSPAGGARGSVTRGDQECFDESFE